MRKIASLLLCLCVVVVRSFALDGQVFVVTAGRDNVKMGGVSVAAYRASEFNASLARVAATLAPAFHAMEEQIARIDREIKVAQISLQPTHQLETRREALKHAISEKYSTVWDGLRSVTPLATAVTDADGRFKMNIRESAGVVLFAQASRRVVNSTEHYLWVERVEGASVILSNSQDMGEGWAAVECKRAYADFVAQKKRERVAETLSVRNAIPKPGATVQSARSELPTFASLSVGMTKEQVLVTMGEPTVKADGKWFYPSRGWVRFNGETVASLDAR